MQAIPSPCGPGDWCPPSLPPALARCRGTAVRSPPGHACRRWLHRPATHNQPRRVDVGAGAAAASPASAVRIRPGEAEDIGQLWAIEQLCEPLGGAGWSQEQMQEELGRPLARMLVACSSTDASTDSSAQQEGGGGGDGSSGGAELLGFICGWLVADEIQVLELAVHPQQQGRGVGRRLLAALLLQCSCDRNSAFLEVRAGNAAAQALYSGLGFQGVGRRRRYYPDGEDALLMQRPPAALAGAAAAPAPGQ